MTKWNPIFLTLPPSAAKVFAIAWEKKIVALLEERGLQTPNGEVLEEAFKVTVEKSSSLPVRDFEYRLLTLHCAISLLASYHFYGETIDSSLKPCGWSDEVYNRYFRLHRRHGIKFQVVSA